MKKILLSIVAIMAICLTANAASYKIIPNELTWHQNGEQGFYALSSDKAVDVFLQNDENTISVTTPTDLIKVYKGAKLTISMEKNGNITTIVFKCTSGYCNDMAAMKNEATATTSTGKTTVDNNNLTVTWEATEDLDGLIFKASTAQVRISEIDVYTDGTQPEAEPAPTEVTCAQAKEAALALESGATSTDTYVVTGYITNIVGSASKNQQSFWIDDTKDGDKVFEAYWANLPEGVTEFILGSKVKIKGKLMNYKGTPEIKNATVTILEAPTAINTVNADVKAEKAGKFIENGQVVILKSGKKYNVAGALLK